MSYLMLLGVGAGLWVWLRNQFRPSLSHTPKFNPIPISQQNSESKKEIHASKTLPSDSSATTPGKIDCDWKRFWELFSADELNESQKIEMGILRSRLNEIHEAAEREEKRKAEESLKMLRLRLAELGINDDRSAYMVNREDYKRGLEKEREYIRQHRNFLFRVYDNRCAKCGNDSNGLDVDHFFISKNEGGCFQMLHRDGFYVNNAIPLCESCNRSKSDKNYRVFFSVKELLRILELNAKMNLRLNEKKISKWKTNHWRDYVEISLN